MPTLYIRTNVHKSEVASDFLHKASEMFQQAIRKPMEYIQVVLIPDVMMAYGNTTDPSAYIEIVSIGHLGPTANQRISGAVFEFIKKELGIDSKRAYINFNVKEAYEIGYNNSTCDSFAGPQ